MLPGLQFKLPISKGEVLVGLLRVLLHHFAVIGGDTQAPWDDIPKGSALIKDGEGVPVAEGIGDLEEGRATEGDDEAVVGEGVGVAEEEGRPCGPAQVDVLVGGWRWDDLVTPT